MSWAFRIMIAAVIAATSSGCIKSMLLNGQIAGTRQASAAFDGVTDFDLAYRAASSGLVQFEGMHVLAPNNEDALFLLAKGYTGYAYGFVEDELENAQDAADRELAAYHLKRAVDAYQRAINYGLELLAKSDGGFEEAKKGEAAMKAWLKKNFTDKEDAPNIFWTGYAWMARTNLIKDDAEAVANLWIGVNLMEHSVALDPDYNNSIGTMILAAYHGRTATADLELSKKLFEEVSAKTQGKLLMVKFQYATKFACAKADGAMYRKLLTEVVQSEESEPSMRLLNTLAKRRAQRWLGQQRMFDACGIEEETAAQGENDAS